MSVENSKKISENCNYKMEYSWTLKAWNSNDAMSKIVRYSVLGIAILAVTETIVELVKIPLKFIRNIFELNKNSSVESKSKKISQIKTNLELPKKKEQIEQQNKEVANEKKLEKTTNWKKNTALGLGFLGVCFLVWKVYVSYSGIFSISNIPNLNERLNSYIHPISNDRLVEDNEQNMCSIIKPYHESNNTSFCSNNENPQTTKRQFFDLQQICPTFESFKNNKAENFYGGWFTSSYV